MGVGVFARLQHTPGIRQWDPRAENWVPICASIWDQNPRLGPAANGSDIKVLYCFHQNNDDSRCEAVHTSPPVIPHKIRQTWKPGGEQMAPKLATVTIVLAMALTILTAITWAAPIWSPIFGPQLL